MARTIDKKTIEYLSTLANLKLTESEKEKYLKDLQAVLTHMDDIAKLDTTSIEETSRVTEEINVMRDDAFGESFTQEEALKNASSTHNGYFVVNRVIDNE